MDRAHEIALARSAAPASVSAKARVLVFDGNDFVAVDSGGGNGVTCVVNRSWPESIEPHCYDEEASRTVPPVSLRRMVLRHRGLNDQEIEREIATKLSTGVYKMPRRPAMTYMMSAAQVLYSDGGRMVGPWKPHLMIYVPYLSAADVGLATAPDLRVGMVSNPGTPFANLMIVMPAAIAVGERP